MAYWISKFGTTTIAQVEPVHDLSLPAKAQGVETIGAAIDEWGSGVAPIATPYRITVRGEEYANTKATLGTKFYALRSLVGTRDKLYRTPDSTSSQEWVYARLINMSASRDGHSQLAVPYSMTFAIFGPVWNGTSHTTTAALGTEPSTVVAVYNGGNAPVRTPIITITASTNDITSVTIAANGESSISWAGTLASGNDLVIDCGAGTVRNDGADAYSGVTFNAGHTVSYWVGLGATATTTLTVTRTAAGTDVAGLVTVSYYEGWY
jgi:hypothetical protein